MRKMFVFTALLFIILPNLQAQDTDFLLNEIKYKSPVTAIEVSHNGKWLLVGQENGSLQILDAVSLKKIMTAKNVGSAAIKDIELTLADEIIFCASGNRIMLIDTLGNPLLNWGQRFTIWCLDLHPSGTHLLSAEFNDYFDMWNVIDGKIETTFKAHKEPTMSVCFNSEGTLLASGSNDRTVRIWDMETRLTKHILRGHSEGVYDVAFSPDGKYLAACSADKTVRIWDIEKEKQVYILKGHRDVVWEVEFSPDGRYLLSSSSDMSIILWEIANGEKVYEYIDNDGIIVDIKMMPDGKSFASAGFDKRLKIWDINPEIFVLKYYYDDYMKELDENTLFQPKQKGERGSAYKERMLQAEQEKNSIVEKYYSKYLELRKSFSSEAE